MKVKSIKTTAMLSLALSLILLGGCAQTAKPVQPSASVVPASSVSAQRTMALGGGFVTPMAIGLSQTRVVVYRSAQSRLPGATSVFVDGRYHASLVAGAWSALCYKAGPVELGARQMQVGAAPKDLMDSFSAITLMPGQTHYLRVQESQARPVLEPVAQAQALQEMTGSREQLHTVSRAGQDCLAQTAPVLAAAPPAPSERITLPADTLFAFDRSDAQAMTGSGLQAIDRLLARIRSDYAQVDHLHIIGHADPLGNAERNEQLSQQRAQTVREHLLGKGLGEMRITTEGRGSREPMVTTCARQATPASIACNLPNRRVVVVVTGQRR